MTNTQTVALPKLHGLLLETIANRSSDTFEADGSCTVENAG